jgi:hypothetical protein
MSPAPSRRAWSIVAGAAVLAGAVVAVILVTTGGDDDTANPQPTPTLVTGPGLDTGGIALATLLAGAREHTFHAKYAVRGSTEKLGGTLELEWWNTADRSRIDTTRTTGDSVEHTASFVLGSTGYGCEQIDSGPWSCHPIQVPAEGDPNGMISTLTAQLSGRQVSERPGKVNGISARCFHVSGPGEPLDVCTDADGVLLRNATSEVAYEITDLNDDVPDSIFDPPAPVK